MRKIALCVTWFKVREDLCVFDGLKTRGLSLSCVVDDGRRQEAGDGGVFVLL
jgi:hypothetical protein